MPDPITYTMENLSDAREFLSEFHDPIILTNKIGSTRYYGMLVLDYMFKKLTEEFPQIVKIIVNVENDHAALFTAIKLNYQNIVYTGESSEVRLFCESDLNK
ncbi:MAG: hypothetical protein LN568_03245 [Rickettsia endosymbiont of Pseudomimeciton antennatum]|nr:hypothetical protein [Rickettsia endosymbiont of Pseudomimeciton antennatum]MCC8397960.1 hypothetical protein [Rickettsia endosymbiont of Labidopullus appendiculatus]